MHDPDVAEGIGKAIGIGIGVEIDIESDDDPDPDSETVQQFAWFGALGR